MSVIMVFLSGSQGDDSSTYLEFAFPQVNSIYSIIFRGDGLNIPMYESKS